MRGNDERQEIIFSYVSAEERIPQNHPLRAIREMADRGLQEMDPHFAALYASGGRPSIPPERLVRALLLMILHSIRGERELMEQIKYNLKYRWFVGLTMDDAVWDATVFTKNRERLMRGRVAERFFEAVLAQAREQQLLSEEHSRWMAPCCGPGPAVAVFMLRTSRRAGAAGREKKCCCATRTSRRPIRRRGCTRRARTGW